MSVSVLSAVAHLRLGDAQLARQILEPHAIRARAERRFSRQLQLYIHALIDLEEYREAEAILSVVSTWQLDETRQAAYLLPVARIATAKGNGEKAVDALNQSLEIQHNTFVRLFLAFVQVYLGEISTAAQSASGVRDNELTSELKGLPTLLTRLADDDQRDTEQFEEQIRHYPLEQAGYLILAAHLWRAQDPTAACNVLLSGRRHARATNLLFPSWLADCLPDGHDIDDELSSTQWSTVE